MPQRTRTTFWCRTFAHARQSREWMLVQRLYTHTTAVQLASDISNAHRRTASTLRIRGIAPGERWEARWTPASGGAVGDHHVWIRCSHTIDDVAVATSFSVLETV